MQFFVTDIACAIVVLQPSHGILTVFDCVATDEAVGSMTCKNSTCEDLQDRISFHHVEDLTRKNLFQNDCGNKSATIYYCLFSEDYILSAAFNTGTEESSNLSLILFIVSAILILISAVVVAFFVIFQRKNYKPVMVQSGSVVADAVSLPRSRGGSMRSLQISPRPSVVSQSEVLDIVSP